MEYWLTSIDGTWKHITNNKGFRNTENFDYSKTPGTFRVLSLGDSHTQGAEVRQALTFSSVLERALTRDAPAQVLNTGVSGFSTAEQLVFLEQEGIRYQPDAVVVGFYANDFSDNIKAGLFKLDEQNNLQISKYEHIPGVAIQNVIYRIPGIKWLSENSYFYSLLFNKVWNYFKIKLSESAKQQARGEHAIPQNTADAFELAIPTNTDYTDYEIALAAALLERMHKFCTERGIRFIVVDIPMYSGPYQYRSSLPLTLVNRLNSAKIEYLSSHALLEPFNSAAEMHVAHGQHHISEFTHTLIGAAINRRLIAPR